MTRETFFERHGPISVGDLAERVNAQLGNHADPLRMISDVAPLTDCGPEDVTLVVDRRRAGDVDKLVAGACFVAPEFADRLPAAIAPLVTKTPEAAFAVAIAAFYPDSVRNGLLSGTSGQCAVHETARLGGGVVIEAGAVVGADVEIGANSLICSNAVISKGVKIGRGCVIGPGVSIMHALLGDYVIVHPGARIGQDGFGYARKPDGFVKLPQIGRVIVHDNVEIGANATVDRGALGDTVIGEGSKIDNLVHIAHNVMIGRSCILAGQTGISGSVKLGDGVLAAGQVGINPHVEVGSGAEIGPQSGVNRNIPAGMRVMGSPHSSMEDFLRGVRAVKRLGRRAQRAGEEKT